MAASDRSAGRVRNETIAPLPRGVLLRHAGCVETPLRFGIHGHLFGMFCRPTEPAPGDLAVVIGNTGGHPHHGFAKFGVEFARRLAGHGIASLRIDFAGLGDSINPANNNSDATHTFEVDRVPDFRAAIDALELMGYRQFAVNGLCSGAYHAFRAALEDERIGTLLPINLPWFTLRFEKPAPSSFARSAMAALSDRQVRSLLLFADGDAGLKMVERHFGSNGSELRSLPNTIISILEGIDHNLTGSAMRRVVADTMIEFLRQAAPVQGVSGIP